MDSMGTPEEVIVQGNENTLEGHSEQMKGMTPEQKTFVQNLLKENHKLSQENMVLKKEKSNLLSASDSTDSKEPIDNENKAKPMTLLRGNLLTLDQLAIHVQARKPIWQRSWRRILRRSKI